MSTFNHNDSDVIRAKPAAFDPTIIQEGNGLTLQEELSMQCADLKRLMTKGCPGNAEFEKQQADDLALWIEKNALPYVGYDESIDVFRFNALIYVRDNLATHNLMKDRVKVAAADQVWQKLDVEVKVAPRPCSEYETEVAVDEEADPYDTHIMGEHYRNEAAEKGLGNVKKTLFTATILHEGWEMDNQAWIVEMDDGSQAVFTTGHGRVCRWSRKDAEESLVEIEASAASIRRALELMPADA